LIDKGTPRASELPGIYSELFSDLKNPPKKLYYIGKTELLQKRKIAIVGARRASQYARITTKKLASTLSSLGCVVVSGAAMGIDAAAHEGAGDSTIAVFGNSLDIIYPAVNKTLIEKIYKNSLAISEYESEEKPTNYSFVLRNRLIVAMGEVLIISEAEDDSGSMRSAEIALKLGRQIYILPHRIGESRGSMKLAKDGKAKIIYDLDAFVNELGLDTLPLNSIKKDELLEFCSKTPSFGEAFAIYGEKLYEYELEGKIAILNNKVCVK